MDNNHLTEKVQEVLEAERTRARQRVRLDEPLQVVARFARPGRAADDDERILRALEELAEGLHRLAPRVRHRGHIGTRIGDIHGLGLVRVRPRV